MTTSYPGAVDNLTNPTPSDTLNSATVPHAAQHANVNDAVEAVQSTLGTNPQGTAASVKARLDTLEGVIDDRLPGEANSIQPTGPFPFGYVWVDASSTAIKVWNGTTFVDPSNAGGGTGLPWAVVSGGTVTEYTHPDHGVMQVHTFAANGTLTVVTPGYADVLLVGAGGSSVGGTSTGSGGRIRDGLRSLPAGSLAVTVASGSAGYLPSASGNYYPSSLADLSTGSTTLTGDINGTNRPGSGAGGTAATPAQGYTSSITGTPVLYAPANDVTKYGGGARTGTGEDGGNGVVIVAVKKP